MSSFPISGSINRLNEKRNTNQARIVNGLGGDDNIAQIIGYEVQSLPPPSNPPSNNSYIPAPTETFSGPNSIIQPFAPTFSPTTFNGVVLPAHTPLAIPMQQSKYSNILLWIVGAGLVGAFFLNK